MPGVTQRLALGSKLSVGASHQQATEDVSGSSEPGGLQGRVWGALCSPCAPQQVGGPPLFMCCLKLRLCREAGQAGFLTSGEGREVFMLRDFFLPVCPRAGACPQGTPNTSLSSLELACRWESSHSRVLFPSPRQPWGSGWPVSSAAVGQPWGSGW